MNETGLIDALTTAFGGAATTLIGAATGRLMAHSGEVNAGRRQFFGKELLWEMPTAVGMAIIGEAMAGYLGLDEPMRTGIVALLAYLGPRAVQSLIFKWMRADK